MEYEAQEHDIYETEWTPWFFDNIKKHTVQALRFTYLLVGKIIFSSKILEQFL